MPTSRTGTPRVAARSGLRELRTSGLKHTSTVPTATTLKMAMTGTIEEDSVKIDPNSTLIVAPVVLEVVVSQIQEQGGEPERGPEHDPGGEVASPRATDPDQLHHSCGDHVHATNPYSGLIPTRNARRSTRRCRCRPESGLRRTGRA